MERKIDLMKTVAAKISHEISSFVNEREKRIWRTWEGNSEWLSKLKKKYNSDGSDLSLKQSVQLFLSLHQYTLRLEQKYEQLLKDEFVHQFINTKMMKFCSE